MATPCCLGEVGYLCEVGGLELVALGGEVGVVWVYSELGFEAFDLGTELDAVGGDAADVVAVVAVGAGEVPVFATGGGGFGDDAGCEVGFAVVAGDGFGWHGCCGFRTRGATTRVARTG